MKKFLKITGVVLGILILLLLLSPILFKGSLEKLLKKNLNENLNATVSWEELDLSLFSSFPNAAVVVKNFSVINNAPFKGDTLASGDRLKLDMGITQLFNSENEAIKVDALQLDNAFINIKVDSLGNANYDIAIDKGTTEEENTAETASNGFTFDLDHYEINDSRINYLDEKSQTFLTLTDFNHEGNGDLASKISELETTTNAHVSFRIEDVEYLHENHISLDAKFKLDLENQKYTFLENEAKVNELPLTFEGFVKVNESNNEIDLTFKTPSSDFKNFLAVIPKTYVKNLEGVTTTGDFAVNGMLKGVVDEIYIPKMDISVKSSNASFKYPDLPKTVKNISIDVELKNDTGLVKDTYLNIGGLSFRIDDELFTTNGSIRNLTENALVDLAIKGTLDLAKIEKVLPLEMEQQLSGVFTADIKTNFDMNSIETEQYQKITTNGTAALTGFTYSDPAFQNNINIQEANIKMSPGNITLKKLNATSGETDIAATGSIQNLIPWVMAKQDLKGNFDVQSNTFNVNDFMSAETSSNIEAEAGANAETNSEGSKIPDFLDATLNFNAKKVIYDNLELGNTKGTVKIANETATLSNVTSKIFGGDVAFSGNVSTQNTTPTFDMSLDLQKIDIDESFGKLSLLKYVAPIAKALDGNLNTKLQLKGNLKEDFTPDLTTLAGSALAQVLTAEVNPEKTPLLSKLGEQITFLNLDKLSLKDVTTAFDFSDGQIIVKPFDFDVKGIKVTASGAHGLDKNLNYKASLDVPAKYLGSEVTKLLSKLDPSEADKMTVNVPVGISGSFTAPKVDLNTKAAISELTNKIIQKQKETLIDKGTDILGGLLGGKNEATDSTSTQNNTGIIPKNETTEVVKDILGGLFSKKKKKKDSTGN